MSIQRRTLACQITRSAALVLLAALFQPAQAQTVATTAPERAISHAEFQDNLDEVRRHYPKLYDRLRRAPRVDTTQRTTEPEAPIPIETWLKQTVRSSRPTNTIPPISRGTP